MGSIAETVGKYLPFNWWPNFVAEEARWFGLNAFGQGLLHFLLALVCNFFGWVGLWIFTFKAIPQLISNWLKTGSHFKED